MAADQSASFDRYRRPTRRDEFLATMNAIVPWTALCDVIQPYYAKGVGGRPPIGLECTLRIHFIQEWFNLADEACEEALYDSASLRRFEGIDLGREPVPDAITMLKFRGLHNENKLGEQLFAKVGEVLQQGGFKLKTGTIVDATIIGAPSSTKNADKWLLRIAMETSASPSAVGEVRVNNAAEAAARMIRSRHTKASSGPVPTPRTVIDMR